MLRGHGALVEWQTRQIATVVASTVPVGKGKRNPLQGLVDAIRLYPEDEEPSGPKRGSGGRREPQRGSYEAFLGIFGRAMDKTPREEVTEP